MSIPALTRDLTRALLAFLALTLVCGVIYPAVVWAVGHAAFSDRASGSLVERDGVVVGSSLIGQSFTGAQWFQSRPSAVDYDANASSGSNLGPNSKALATQAHGFAAAAAKANGVPLARVPADLATTSGSGLDPDISPAAAQLQVARVARARGLTPATVQRLVADATNDPTLGFMGTKRVNVLRLNLALQQAR